MKRIERKPALQAAAAAALALALLACNFSRYAGEATPTAALLTAEPGETALPEPATPGAGKPEASREVPGNGEPVASAPRLVYTKEEALWEISGGEKRKITSQGAAFNPDLSPDGSVVAFLRPADEFHTELWAVNADGSSERRLVSISDLDTIGGGVRDPNAVAVNPNRYAWVADSRDLAFNTHQVFNGPGLSLLEDLNTVSADSGAINNLFLSGSGGEFAFSQDGKQVALSKPDSILLSNTDGSSYRTVMTYSPVVTYSEYRYYAVPVWSPDGRFLRVAIPPADPLAGTQPTSLWKIPVDGSSPVQEGAVQTAPFFEYAAGFQPPVYYSPDLGRIAYLRPAGPDTDNTRELVVATYDGQGEMVAAKGTHLHFLGWSPDGRSFLYSIGELQELWLGSLDSSPKPVSGVQFGAHDARWVDGETLLVVQQQEQVYRLLLVDLKGSATELDVLAEPPAFDFVP